MHSSGISKFKFTTAHMKNLFTETKCNYRHSDEQESKSNSEETTIFH